MPGGVEMFGGVFIRRLVAAAHVPANPADTQMDPPIASLQAFFTAFSARFDIFDLVEMGAGAHEILL